MSLLSDLYQEVILDHNRRPRNYGRLADSTGEAEGFNPLCGDRVTVYIKMDGERISGLSFEGTGCAISTASASIMTEVLRGRTLEDARELFEKFRDMVMGKIPADSSSSDEALGKLVVFHRLSEYPVRVKCATLVWHALLAALERGREAVTME